MPQPPAAMFWYNDNGKPTGPVPLAEIEARIKAGKIGPDTLMWKVGTPRWTTAKEIPEVAALLGTKPPPAPAFDAKTYVLGTWKSEQRGNDGQPLYTYVFAADGTMTARGGTIVNDVPMQLSGTYTLQETGPKAITIQGKLTGRNGENFVSLVMTRAFVVVDGHTMRDAKDHALFTRTSGP
jgi:hypothetical protein